MVPFSHTYLYRSLCTFRSFYNSITSAYVLCTRNMQPKSARERAVCSLHEDGYMRPRTALDEDIHNGLQASTVAVVKTLDLFAIDIKHANQSLLESPLVA